MKRNTCRRVVLSTLCMALAVIAHAQTLCESVDACGLVWTTGGNAAWIGQTNKTHDGVDAGTSGVITHNQEVWMETTVNGPGTISFWWNVSSLNSGDFLEFQTNGVMYSRIYGTAGTWSLVTLRANVGQQTLRWRYAKNASGSFGEDRGWVDQVSFLPDDSLGVQPGSDLISSGYIAGPFNPSNKVYTLTNASATELDWSANTDQGWVTILPSGGSLVAGASSNVTILINANAQSLGYGAQIARVAFSNLTSGVSQSRGVQLTVKVAPATRFVNLISFTPVFPYNSWTTAATNIQDAIDAALPGDVVLVTNGIYQVGARLVNGMSNRVAVTKPVTIQSVNGPEVTSIAGYQLPGTNNGPAAVRCVYLASGALLSGFKLTGGATQTSNDVETNRSGGGVWCESVSAVVSNSIIQGNSADFYAGGAYSGTLRQCTLTDNSANQGGGAYRSTLNRCTLSGNSASFRGGGVYLSTLNNCILTSNSAGLGGGALQSTLNNCTLTRNSAVSAGGVSESRLTNCILYFNTAQSADNYEPTSVNLYLNYCCTTPLPSGTGNISLEPQLASKSHLSAASPCRGAGSAAYATGQDLDGEPWANPPSIGCDEYWSGSVTGALSVAIVVAYTNVATGFELDFQEVIAGRVSASRWDYGDGTVVSNRPYASHVWSVAGDYVVELRAYNETYPNGITATVVVHVAAPPVHYVSLSSSNPVPPFADWANAATTIQDAVNVAAVPGALVLVSNGVYAAGATTVNGMSNRVAVTKPVTVQSVNGPAVTTIHGYREFGTNGPAAVRCVYLTSGALLSGFTLTNGATQTSGDVDKNRSGGGVWCESIRVVVTNCLLTGNIGANNGGGVYSGTLNSSTISSNSASGQGAGAYRSALNFCTITGNTAGSGGGATACTLNNCTLTGNVASGGGGALACTLNNCTLTGNSATYNPGGGASSSTLTNCTLIGNSAPGQGGGAYSGTLYNCSLVGNSAANGGGTDHCINNNCTLIGNAGIQGGGASYSTLNNCIAYYNTAASQGPNHIYSILNNCCTTPLSTGAGNISSEPLFVDTNAWSNLRLQSNSPCINAGNNAYVTTATDFDGLPRISGSTVDMGAYEFQGIGLSGFAAWLWQYGLRTDGSGDFSDPDGDSMNNYSEWRADTIPTNALSTLRILTATNTPTGVKVTWQSVATRNYWLERATNVASGSTFQTVATNIIGAVGSKSTTDTTATNRGPYFFRVGVN